jgi:hypothetical protein
MCKDANTARFSLPKHRVWLVVQGVFVFDKIIERKRPGPIALDGGAQRRVDVILDDFVQSTYGDDCSPCRRE